MESKASEEQHPPKKPPRVMDANLSSPAPPRGCCSRITHKITSLLSWVCKDFTLKHLIWIKLIFFFQSASMTVLYPYLNLHMKSLGLSVLEASVINAIVPILFIFTPPLANFLHDRLGSFRVLLAVLTALGGCVSLLLLIIPVGRDVRPYPEYLEWGLSCGKADHRARFQKMMIQGFRKDQCESHLPPPEEKSFLLNNITFTPGPCGYLCPTRASLRVKPRFNEYKVIWPNRGGGFGISEIVDIVKLEDSPPEARIYHEPEIIDNNIFFPMNWTFHLSCDRIRPNDCVFNPHPRLLEGRNDPSESTYNIQLRPQRNQFEAQGPLYEIASIWPPTSRRPVTSAVNCGAKEVMAQVVTTVETNTLPATFKSAPPPPTLVDTRFSGCGLHCLVRIPRAKLCSNTQKNDVRDPALTFWSYLLVRTTLGVLTAASLMMFEGAVMSTIQELGGDYGIQRFVGNFGAIIFAPLGGYLLDISNASSSTTIAEEANRDYKSPVFVYLILKILASLMLLFIDLDFKPPGEKILKGICRILRNAEVVMFLLMMLFAGMFWGYIESFLFWFLDDLKVNKFLMGLTIAVGMITSLPFLIFSGPITELIGHASVIIIGMWAYFIRLIGYSYLEDPLFVYPYEALEGFTMALMMTSSVTYVAKIGSPDTIPSIMGIMGALFFGVGKGSGALIGGVLMSLLGTRITFRCFAGTSLLCSIVYIFFQLCFVRRKAPQMRDEQETEEPSESKDYGPSSPEEGEGGEVNETYEDNEKGPGPASTVILGGIVNGMNLNNPASGPRSLTEGTRV
eukprot:TRINITY_DN4734_c0_g1_i1.p1 TRINITY_DN4734_c0_g1~~TRINITY_DN4734_c0_g1_i1.p1  ORF type:complete len:792 (-),score=179.13 TRINITY_DN4734_c0_g1_i1:362-2737(-)